MVPHGNAAAVVPERRLERTLDITVAGVHRHAIMPCHQSEARGLVVERGGWAVGLYCSVLGNRWY
jgi:hypothetical protein